MVTNFPRYRLFIPLVIAGFILCTAALCSNNAFATAKQYDLDMGGQGPYRPLPEDWEFLPEYCRPRIGEKQEKKKYKALSKKWGKILATPGARNVTESGWSHTHHYCAGLTALVRIQRGVGKRSALLAEAQNQFEYMVNSSHPSYVLMPEIRWRLGQVKRERNDMEGAIAEFVAAIGLKPDFAPPYLDLANLYDAKGDSKSALEVIEIGLLKASDKKGLRVLKQHITSR